MFFSFLVWNRVWFWQGTCSFISLVILTLTRDIQTTIVQTEGQSRSEMGYRFLGSGLKRGMKNHIFWSKIGSGFWEPCGTPLPKSFGSIPHGMRLTKLSQKYAVITWILEWLSTSTENQSRLLSWHWPFWSDLTASGSALSIQDTQL